MLMPSKLPMPSNNFYFRHQYLSGSDVIWWLTHDSDTLVILWWHVPALVCMNSDNQWRVTLMMQPVWPQIIQQYWTLIGQISVTWLNTGLRLVRLVSHDWILDSDWSTEYWIGVMWLNMMTARVRAIITCLIFITAPEARGQTDKRCFLEGGWSTISFFVREDLTPDSVIGRIRAIGVVGQDIDLRLAPGQVTISFACLHNWIYLVKRYKLCRQNWH